MNLPIDIYLQLYMNVSLLNACQGKTASQGGLNVPEMKKQLGDLFPEKAAEIKSARTRDDLNKICVELSKTKVTPSVTSRSEPRLPTVRQSSQKHEKQPDQQQAASTPIF